MEALKGLKDGENYTEAYSQLVADGVNTANATAAEAVEQAVAAQPNQVAFTPELAFTHTVVTMAAHTQAADIAFTLADVPALVGSTISVRIVGDSVHTVTFPESFKVLSPAFDNKTTNFLMFYLASETEVWVGIQREGGSGGGSGGGGTVPPELSTIRLKMGGADMLLNGVLFEAASAYKSGALMHEQSNSGAIENTIYDALYQTYAVIYEGGAVLEYTLPAVVAGNYRIFFHIPGQGNRSKQNHFINGVQVETELDVLASNQAIVRSYVIAHPGGPLKLKVTAAIDGNPAWWAAAEILPLGSVSAAPLS